MSVVTENVLYPQSLESRRRNVILALADEFDKQFGFQLLTNPNDPHVLLDPGLIDASLAEVGFVGTISERVAGIIARVFPFVPGPNSLVTASTTFNDLVARILSHVRAPAHDEPAPLFEKAGS